MAVTVTTKLEAVNFMLTMAGEHTVSALSTSSIASFESIAEDLLDATSKGIQSEGINCNTETKIKLTPDSVTNKIAVPSDAIGIDAYYTSKEVVRRGDYLYDKTDHTFEFSNDLYVDIIYALDFTDLPEAVRKYILAKAGRSLVLRLTGDTSLYNAYYGEEIDAKSAFLDNESATDDYNIVRTMPKIFNRTV